MTSYLTALLAFVLGMAVMAWLRGELEHPQCGDCLDKDQAIRELTADLASERALVEEFLRSLDRSAEFFAQRRPAR